MYGTQCNDIILNIVFIRMFFMLFSNRMIRFFLLFSVNCSQLAMFQIMPAFCPHGQGEGVVNLICTDLDRGRGVPKIPKFVRISSMDDPYPQKQLFVAVFQSRFS